jgi:hypothetical protein
VTFTWVEACIAVDSRSSSHCMCTCTDHDRPHSLLCSRYDLEWSSGDVMQLLAAVSKQPSTRTFHTAINTHDHTQVPRALVQASYSHAPPLRVHHSPSHAASMRTHVQCQLCFSRMHDALAMPQYAQQTPCSHSSIVHAVLAMTQSSPMRATDALLAHFCYPRSASGPCRTSWPWCRSTSH